MSKLILTLGLLVVSGLAGGQLQAQPVYYNGSSTLQSLNSVSSVATNGTGNTALFTASGAVSRCTAVAVDGLSGKLFLLDGPANALWSVNLNGTGLTLVKTNLTSFPTDLALDVLNQKIYYTSSSTLQSSNTVQRMDYTGSNNVILLTATGTPGNGVARCTALAVDPLNSKIFIADAGAQKIWSLSLTGTGLTALATATNAYPTGLALDVTNQQVYFTLGSTVQNSNLIQRVNYNGAGLLTRFAAAAGSVQRCTALNLDLAHSLISLSDAGAGTLWKIPLGGGSAVSVLSGLPATAKKVRWYNGPLTRPPPGLNGVSHAGSNVLLNATNGFVGGTYYVLTSTNLALPRNQWQTLYSTVLGASGSFALTATNGFDAKNPRQFYLLQVQ